MRRFRWLVAGLVALCATGVASAAPGDLDTTFSGDGVWTNQAATSASDVLVQPDGSIVAVGDYVGGDDFWISMLAADGTQLDALRVSVGTGDHAEAVARQADGKLVVVGLTGRPSGGARLAIARVTPANLITSMRLDTSFDGDGVKVIDLGVLFVVSPDVLVQPDGKIVVVDSRKLLTQDVAVIRLNPDGSFDSSFGGDGIVEVDFGGTEYGEAIAQQPDGKLVVSGLGEYRTIVARLLPGGSLDPTFDGDGRLTVDLAGDGRAIAVQGDGKVIVAGRGSGAADSDVSVVRLQADGAIDGSYAGDGSMTLDLGYDDVANDAALLANGKLILAVDSHADTQPVHDNAPNEMVLVQVTPAGVIDASFGVDGVRKVRVSPYVTAAAVAVQPDGAALVAGTTGTFDPQRPESVSAVVARVLDDPPPAGLPPAPAPLPPPPPPPPPPAPGPGRIPLCHGQIATIVGTAGSETLRGTPQADVIVAKGGRDTIFGRGGNDVICAGDGADRVRGGSGADRIFGGTGSDVLQGEAGEDSLAGGPGDDSLQGGRDDDRCVDHEGINRFSLCEVKEDGP